MCLGLRQGMMSMAFNYFPIKTLGVGAWIGTDAYFHSPQNCLESIRCTSPVSVLEINILDFQQKMPENKIQELKKKSFETELNKINRMGQIAQTAKDVKMRDSMNKFHQEALISLLKLHPHASKRMINQLSNSQQLEGFIRTARYKDAINIG